MNQSVRKITVSILGEMYNLVSDEDEQVVRHAARMVDAALRDVQERIKDASFDASKLTTLVAVRMAVMLCAKEQEFVKHNQRMLSLLDNVN